MYQERTLNYKQVTIVDIAKAAGVSISTVSRVLNHQGGVSVELEMRVVAAARRLNYRPNSIARSLKNRETRLIGVVVPSISNPVFAISAEHYTRAADQYGYSLITCSSNASVDQEANCLEKLINYQVDGIIFNGMGRYDPRFGLLAENGTPMVYVGRRIPEISCSSVTLNNQAGSYQATAYLIQTGARRIGFIFGCQESYTAAEDRFLGYRAALQDHGIPFDEHLTVQAVEMDPEVSGENATHQLLAQAIHLDAIVISGDLIALGCLKTLLEMGIRVPEDISVIGYDGIPYGRLMTPVLTTVVSPLKEMSDQAIALLVQQIEGRKIENREVVFQPSIYFGATTRSNESGR